MLQMQCFYNIILVMLTAITEKADHHMVSDKTDKPTDVALFPTKTNFLKMTLKCKKKKRNKQTNKQNKKSRCDDHVVSNKATADKATVVALFPSKTNFFIEDHF